MINRWLPFFGGKKISPRFHDRKGHGFAGNSAEPARLTESTHESCHREGYQERKDEGH